jgi:hypothetical protein
MLKKIMLSAVVLCTALSLAAVPRIRVDQSSKRAAAESLVKAICLNDAEGLKAVLSPGLADTMQETLKIIKPELTFADIFKIFSDGLKKECKVQDCRQIIRNQETFRKAVDQMVGNGSNWIKLNGKWYAYMSIVDHSSKERLVTTFAVAIKNCDVVTLFEIFSPEMQRKMIEESGSKEKAIENLTKEIKAEECQSAWEKVDLTDPAKRQKIVQLLERNNELVQINGKWYLNFGLTGKEAAKDKEIHASREAVIEAMLQAACDSNEKLFWEILAPSFRKRAVAEFGSEEKAQKELLKIFCNGLGENLPKMKELFKDKDSKERLIKIEVEALNKALVNIDGKWYVDFSKL